MLKSLGEPLAENSTSDVGRVDEPRRLKLCEEQLARLPSESAIAVWLVIDNAALPTPFLDFGPIWLFDGRSWPEDYAAERVGAMITPPGRPAPEEFEHWDEAAHAFSLLPKAEHRVFARVSLHDTTSTKAHQRARRVLQEMIDLAKADSAWVMLGGAISWRTGALGWAEDGYHDPAEPDVAPHPVHERTATSLRYFKPEYVQRWLSGDPRVAEAVDDALWSVAVERAPAASQRILLGTRAVERVLGQARESVNDSWAPAATRYLRAPWVRYRLNNELSDAAWEAASGVEHQNPPGGLKQELFAMMEKSRPWSEFMADFAALAPDALAALDVGTMRHRIVRDAVAVMDSPAAALARIRELGRQFDRLLARAERQRNALVHGTGTSEAVLDDVADFVLVLAGYVAREVMRSADRRREPLIELEQLRVQALEREVRLQAGHPPLSVLWSEDPDPF